MAQTRAQQKEREEIADSVADSVKDQAPGRGAGGDQKAKRGSSRSARRAEDIERRVSKAIRRVTGAVDRGVETYIDARDKSARKRRDGALVDFYENVTRGVSKAVAKSSPAAVDVAKAFNTKRSRRRMRASFKALRIPFVG